MNLVLRPSHCRSLLNSAGAIQSGGIIKVSLKKDKIDLNYLPKNKKTKK